MALKLDKLQSLQTKIEGLEVQKGMKTAVTQIKEDLFNLFVDTKIRVSDKRSVNDLHKGLSERIDLYTKQIDAKADTEKVNGITVSAIKATITALRKQISILQDIKNIIEQINTPSRIESSVLAPDISSIAIQSGAIVKDFSEFDIKLGKKAKVSKNNNDTHALDVDPVGDRRYQLRHEGERVAILFYEKSTQTWKIDLEKDRIKELGITSFDLPMVVTKDMSLPSVDGTKPVGKTSVEKQKTWKVVLDNWDYTPAAPTVVEPVVEEEPEVTPAPEVVENTSAQIVDVFAHVMDKESLVKKSITQDVLEEYQHKYAKRRWPKRFAMYMYGRIMQNRRIDDRLATSKNHNEAIETDVKRQQRIASSIGNFAYEYDLGVDQGKVTKTALASNDQVNSIADQYIKGTIDRAAAVEQFNDFFSNNEEYATGMTGTDIMEQLDDIAFMIAVESSIKPKVDRKTEDYRKMADVISQFYATHPTAKLQNVHLNNPHNPSTTELDKMADHILAYKSKVAVDKLNNITANVKIYRVEKDTETNDLTESKIEKQSGNLADWVLGLANGATFGVSGALVGTAVGRATIKAMTGAGLVAGGFGTLPVVGGVAAMAAALQWLKTHRDYMTEATKTHEDAMMMGTEELNKRIKELEAQIKKHSGLQKTMAFWGFGNHAIRTKQLNILKAVNDKMHSTGAMKPALQLIKDMQLTNKNQQALALAETLARVQVGRELNTNFISGSNRGLTEQERKDLLIQLREAGSQWAIKAGYAHLVPARNALPEKWRDFWVYVLLGDKTVKTHYDRRCEGLKKAFDDMKDDINTGRKKMAWRDAATNLATSATIAGVSAGVSTLFGGSGWVPGKNSVSGNGPHNEYTLGKYDETLSPGSVTDKASGRDAAFSNGDKVSFNGEAAVDAVHATTKTFGNLTKEIADTELLARAFDPTTQAAVHDALTTELAKIKAEAIASGADAGNIVLVQQRWVDGVEEILTKFTVAGKTGITIEEIKFDPSSFWSIDIDKSVIAGSGVSMQDAVDRAVAFDAKVDGVRGHYDFGDPLWVVWPGFSNTYAKPGKESKHDDSWSKRAEDLDKKDKEKAKKDKEQAAADDDFNRDFEDRHGGGDTPPPYTPTPPVKDKKKHREDKWQDNQDKPFEEPGKKPENRPYGSADDEWGVSPRGREPSRVNPGEDGGDVPTYFEKDYPNKPEILDAHQAAEKIIAAKIYNRPLSDIPFVVDSNYVMGQNGTKIEEAIQAKNYKLAIDLLEQTIISEQAYIDQESRTQGYDKLIRSSLKAVDTVFDELGVRPNDRAEVPDMEHVHIIPGYLFHAQYASYSKNTLGFVYNMNGHMFINHEALIHGPVGDRSDEDRKQVLLHIITHEIVHGATISNYHKTWKENNDKTIREGSEQYVFLRRLGVQLTRRIDKGGQVYFEERGRALNEGLTESLNLYILHDKLGMSVPSGIEAYPAERKVVDKLVAKFELDKKDLYKFLIHRKFGKDIIKKAYGNVVKRIDVADKEYDSYERPGYITLLMELMDMEHLKNADGALPLADKFIDGKEILLPKAQTREFHPSLINKDGSLKPEILQAYPFIKQ